MGTIADSGREDRDDALGVAGTAVGPDEAIAEDSAREKQLLGLLQALTERLRATELLGQRGLLAASVGHELNNALTAVLGNLECLTAELSRDDGPNLMNAQVLLTDALDASRGAAALARDLHTGLGSSSGASSDRGTLIDLREVVRATVRMARPRLRRRALVRESYPGDIPMIRADPRSVAQVVLNLLLNAEQALPADGDLGDKTIGVELGVDAEGRAVISVSDSGCGMDEDTAAHIFDPFFTRRESGEGTGLGLFLSQQLIRDSGGMIEVDSEPDRGTVFFVTFPPPGLSSQRRESRPGASALEPAP